MFSGGGLFREGADALPTYAAGYSPGTLTYLRPPPKLFHLGYGSSVQVVSPGLCTSLDFLRSCRLEGTPACGRACLRLRRLLQIVSICKWLHSLITSALGMYKVPCLGVPPKQELGMLAVHFLSRVSDSVRILISVILGDCSEVTCILSLRDADDQGLLHPRYCFNAKLQGGVEGGWRDAETIWLYV